MIRAAAETAARSGTEGFTRIDDESVYRIVDVDRMPPFFLSIPSSSDLWMFLTSRGGITAGRVDADGAVFPYEPVDRLEDAHRHTGPVTLIRVHGDDPASAPWEPLSDRSAEDPDTGRSLSKSLSGNAVTFEETHRRLGLAFRYRWSAADAWGLVRTVTLTNLADRPVTVDLLDGLRNVLPHGAPLALYRNASCLVDAYKRADLDPTGLAVFSLTSRIVDRAEASECLRANTVWHAGGPGLRVALGDEAIDAFRRGEGFDAPAVLTGRRGNYLLSGSLTLPAGGSARWHVVADAARSQADIAALRARIRGEHDLVGVLDRALDEATAELRRIVARTDGLQLTADRAVCAHQFESVLFNGLRGGVFADGHRIPARDFREFLKSRNRRVAARRREFLDGLPERLPAPDLVKAAEAAGDPDLHRLAMEYLPIGFGRRHGDPSRPWNRFTIRVRNADGSPALHYEGNWRDIFQNWEALALSHPRFLPGFIAAFLNASTVDGFNPYRITRDGVDWEVQDPDDPWSYIGYWGDHQIVYLLRLLEAQDRFDPGALEELLDRRIFGYADVPYRIAPYLDIVRDPHATIRFDTERQRLIEARVAGIGGDGRLVHEDSGDLRRASLLEKLLVPALSKLSNLVPGGGIWMNTQRPEWNDANNALAGDGLSVVTMCHLRRYLEFLERRLADVGGSAPISPAVATWLRAIDAELRRAAAAPPTTPEERRCWMDAVGSAFSAYRATVYAHGLTGSEPLEIAAAADFCRRGREVLDREILAQRREDGLFHSYNVLTLEDGAARVRRLPEMLEGQVAALDSGVVSARATVELLRRMFAGPLYREDQRSFLLYPERELPAFLDRNVVPGPEAAAVPLLQGMLQAGDGRIVTRDADGIVRFHADFANARDVEAALDALGRDGRWSDRAAADRAAVLALYESVFRHRLFTGRSGTMYGYEGLGCIYWHMVAKLLVAVQEIARRADRDGEPETVQAELAAAYYRVRDGLGFRKTAAEFGAFPLDPYSHTPRHAGARQPGMTGQAKEQILARLGELGVRVRDGEACFRPFLLRREELLEESGELVHDAGPEGWASLHVPAGGLAFTFCGVPVVYATGEETRIVVHRRDAPPLRFEGDTLPVPASRSLFDRDGETLRIEVTIPEDLLLPRGFVS